MEMDDLVNTLKKAGLLLEVDANGKVTKAGLMVTRVANGYLVHNLSVDLQPRQLRAPQIDELVNLFPGLKQVLSRNADTLRRVRFLEERYDSNPFADFFTLDADRPMPKPGTADVKDPASCRGSTAASILPTLRTPSSRSSAASSA